jgi:SMI1 / KNR4 family (SUKH-1)
MVENAQLQALLRAAPKGAIHRGASQKSIDAFAHRVGIKVPDELREWLSLANGAAIGPGGVFGIRPGDEYLDIESCLDAHRAWKKRKWIPVAGDGCGNYYVMPTQGDFGPGFPVAFVDSISDKILGVASRLSLFLIFLLEAELSLVRLIPIYETLLKKHRLPEHLVFPVSDPIWPKWPFDRDYVVRKDPDILKLKKELLPWEADKNG